MSVRELLLALVLLVALALAVHGVSAWSSPAGFLVAAAGLAALGWLFLTEVR